MIQPASKREIRNVEKWGKGIGERDITSHSLITRMRMWIEYRRTIRMKKEAKGS